MGIIELGDPVNFSAIAGFDSRQGAMLVFEGTPYRISGRLDIESPTITSALQNTAPFTLTGEIFGTDSTLDIRVSGAGTMHASYEPLTIAPDGRPLGRFVDGGYALTTPEPSTLVLLSARV